jgi:uridine kinase
MTNDPASVPPTPETVAAPLADALTARFESLRRPVFVALDGRSGSGKSTLACALTAACGQRDVGVSVIEGDQFYAGGSAASWDGRSASEKADRVIDWRRQLRVLDDLRRRGVATWHPFDWEAPDWDADVVPLAATAVTATVDDLVVLEGAYSARPELHAILDVLVLLDPPRDRRRRQLLEREGDHYRADWEGRWSAAEDHYFGTVMPPGRFDLVL